MADVEQNQATVEDQESEKPMSEESQQDHSEKSLTKVALRRT